MSVSLLTAIDAALNDTNRTFEGEYIHLERLMRGMCEPENLARFKDTDAGDTLVTMIAARLSKLSCGAAPNDTFIEAMYLFISNYRNPATR